MPSTANTSIASPAENGRDDRFLSASVIDDPVRYRRWRADKLKRARRCLAQPVVEIDDPAHLTAAEWSALRERVEAVNFALYRTAAAFDHAALKRLCRQAGLARLAANPFAEASGISEIRAAARGESRRAYIPYSDRALDWHTDGYYHPPGRPINGFALHTLRAAPRGGENQLLDHELLYLLLRDRVPALVACLFVDDVLTIPPGAEADGSRRPAQTGPVFWVCGGRLRMRFTLRRRHVCWKESPQVRAVLAEIKSILNDPDSPFVLTRRLRAGEGVICNNVLHNRAAFTAPADGQPGRLVLRARFYDRIGFDGASGGA